MIIYLHLLEPSSIDKLVDLALARPEYELDFTFQNRQVVFSRSFHISPYNGSPTCPKA